MPWGGAFERKLSAQFKCPAYARPPPQRLNIDRCITNWSVSSCKGKLKLFRFEIVKYETRAFKRKIEIKPIPILFISLTANNHFCYCCPFLASDFMHNSTGYVIKQLVHAFSCALSSYGALGKFGEHSRS